MTPRWLTLVHRLVILGWLLYALGALWMAVGVHIGPSRLAHPIAAQADAQAP